MNSWLEKKYIIDMLYLTHFYKTGKKLKQVTAIARAYPFKRQLEPIPIPEFIAASAERTRNGIVISF